jgi:prepilin-type N-terminal cleavage/methylation domain-containing protein
MGLLMLNGKRDMSSGPRVAARALNGRARNGFTLIELMIVMAVIVILIAVAIPRYEKSILRAKETVLHSNLFAIRSAIDEYSYDKQKAPQSVQDLVSSGYLRDVPRDPITGSKRHLEVDTGGRGHVGQFDRAGHFRRA